MPSKMNSAPMKVDRLLTLQSMLKIRTPATTSTMPFNSRVVQLRASPSAASRVSRWPNESNDAGVTYMWSSNRLLFSALARRGAPPAALLAGTAHLVDERMATNGIGAGCVAKRLALGVGANEPSELAPVGEDHDLAVLDGRD